MKALILILKMNGGNSIKMMVLVLPCSLLEYIKKRQASSFHVLMVITTFCVTYFAAYFISLGTCCYYPENIQTPHKYSQEYADLP
jgi:hypothetical protein